MKVKVRTIDPAAAPTPALQAILRKHAHDELRVALTTDELYQVMEELTRRREASGRPFRSNEEAWTEFVQHYMPREPGSLIDPTGTPLTPSFHGKDCLGNGEHPGIECCCDECDHYLTCFPDWKEHT